MKISELIFMLLMLIPTVLMAAFGAWALFFVFLAFDICFGLVEPYKGQTPIARKRYAGYRE